MALVSLRDGNGDVPVDIDEVKRIAKELPVVQVAAIVNRDVVLSDLSITDQEHFEQCGRAECLRRRWNFDVPGKGVRRHTMLKSIKYHFLESPKAQRLLTQGRNPMMFAGLWSRWTDPEGKAVATYTVVTTEAMGEVRRVHDRQPQATVSDHPCATPSASASSPS